ncbi:MAG: tetratricopeptide repeat protein [Ignavibacteria bacterium]|nr:tetratricopeptide repeat protein [Ignavibacteria bacterium]MCC7158721.1 tetratricopeptide repeat protein [Ignavibacteria bacterium]
MEKTRLENLKELLAIDPQDSFARYALGLEYAALNEPQSAMETFEELRALDPNYVATYYQLGKVYEMLGSEDEAKKVYEKGVYIAASQSDMHTKSELEQAINELL